MATPSGPNVPFPEELLPIMDISEFRNETKEAQWSEPFSFIHAADTQFGLIEKFFLNKENPGWKSEMKLTKKAIRMINDIQPKVKFLVICGDMLDSRPGDAEERETRQKQYDDFVRILKKDLDPEIKLICVAGNHDLCDLPTEETIDIYRSQFGPDYFDFWVGGVKFVVLNSQYFKNPHGIGTHFQEQMDFIDTIPDDKATQIIVFQHIPFFITDPDEDDVGFLNIEKEYRFPLMDKLIEFGVKFVLCGHYHRNGGGCYKNMEEIITSALGGPMGKDPSGFRIVNVLEDKITHSYITVQDFDENDNFAEEVKSEDVL